MKKMIGMKLNLAVLIMALSVLFACTKEKDDFKAQDDKLIREYLATHNLTAQKSASGLYYIISVPGDTQKPGLNSQIVIHYKGYLLNGTEFDSSYAGSAPTFPMANLIAGWREGLQLFGKGGKGTLFIPSGLGYGTSALPGIPANSVLIFDIHLINIK